MNMLLPTVLKSTHAHGRKKWEIRHQAVVVIKEEQKEDRDTEGGYYSHSPWSGAGQDSLYVLVAMLLQKGGQAGAVRVPLCKRAGTPGHGVLQPVHGWFGASVQLVPALEQWSYFFCRRASRIRNSSHDMLYPLTLAPALTCPMPRKAHRVRVFL